MFLGSYISNLIFFFRWDAAEKIFLNFSLVFFLNSGLSSEIILKFFNRMHFSNFFLSLSNVFQTFFRARKFFCDFWALCVPFCNPFLVSLLHRPLRPEISYKKFYSTNTNISPFAPINHHTQLTKHSEKEIINKHLILP